MLLANIYMYYIEVCLYILVGASQLSAMGDLTRKITESVRGLYTRDEGSYDKFIGRISPRSLNLIVWGLSICINISAVVILFTGCFEGIHLLDKTMYDTGANVFLTITNAYKQPLTMITMLVLSICLLLYFLHMQHTLNKFLSSSLKKERRKINILFGIFLVIYWLRTINCIYAVFVPVQNEVVC